MAVIKYFNILIIFITTTIIGILYSKRYSNRVNDLKEIKNGLNMFKAKIKFTYEPIPEVFSQISKNLAINISSIFEKASKYMENNIAKDAWEKSLEEEKSNTNFNSNDINIIKGLSKMLGNIDLDGQVSNIDLIINFVDKQIEEAYLEKVKNEKLYKTLGIGVGLAIAIILL